MMTYWLWEDIDKKSPIGILLSILITPFMIVIDIMPPMIVFNIVCPIGLLWGKYNKKGGIDNE